MRTLALLAFAALPVSAAADMTDYERVKSAAQDELVTVGVDRVGIIITKLEDALLLSTVSYDVYGKPQLITYTDFSADGTVEQVYYQGSTTDADSASQELFNLLIAIAAEKM